MKKGNKLGIYVHLPFCHSKCAYCDFYSLPSGESLEAQMKVYQKALLAHIATLSPSGQGFQVDTIYFGGGTPTLYGATRIEALLRAMKKAFRVERDVEITVEGNPESVTKKGIQQLRRAGVNRISLGMQSAVLEELRAVGRPHSPQETRDAVAVLKSEKIENMSLDIIYGLPKQSLASWETTVEEAIALEPQHLSCYGLKVEEGTALYTRVEQGELLPSEEEQADLYLWTVARLAKAGYQQYEISNFAKKGYHSRHNMGYWTGKPYLGFGASASSDFGGYRSTMVDDIDQYCHWVLEGGSPILSSHQLMSLGERQAEYLFLGLRTTQGISAQEYEKNCHLDFGPLDRLFRQFAQESWAENPKLGHWNLTAEGFLRSNLLLTALLEAQEHSEPPPPPTVVIRSEKPKESGLGLREDDSGQFHFW